MNELKTSFIYIIIISLRYHYNQYHPTNQPYLQLTPHENPRLQRYIPPPHKPQITKILPLHKPILHKSIIMP